MDAEPLRGLSESEAARRLSVLGPNELQRPAKRGLLRILAETMHEPMFLLMLGAAILYLTLGDLGEGLFLVGAAVVAIGLVILQEARSERALAALRELAQPLVRVIRDGAERRLPARELVPDDILLVGEGERLAADGLLAAGDVLSVDESALTGESSPVSKRLAGAAETFGADTAPGPEPGPWLFAGTLVVRGQGVMRVSRTGTRTALGRIGASLAAIGEEPTPLQKTAGRLVGLLGALALGFCALVAVSYGLLRDDWVGGALAGVTVAISLVPEEFPMVLAVFMALGAWRLAKHHVLVRRSAVIEALGGATVLCVDKTGTLTENRMEVARLWTEGDDIAVEHGRAPHAAGELMALAGLASVVRPVDPMDKAIRRLPATPFPALSLAVDQPERTWPLRPERMAVVQAWRAGDGDWIMAAKGAPEAIFTLCRLPQGEVERLMSVVDAFAEDGLRVLGVAACTGVGDIPEQPDQSAFQFAGLVGFRDPLRDDARAALQEARSAGVNVVMITGDHPATALAVARAAGIDASAGVLLGADLAGMTLDDLRERLRRVRVFARIGPEQKLRIVEALKAGGEVVAMTGDGINDAPALEAAHIGVAMGEKGTDVAREAADLVLLDDSFASIVGGVRLGRRIFINLRRALIYITAIHIPLAGVALAPILLGWPPLLFPMHVALMELAIDPICALVFENEPSDINAMRRPPRHPGEALFGAAQLRLALLQGAGVLIGVLGVYAWGLNAYPEAEARGGAFVCLVLGNLVLALATAISKDGRLFAAHRLIYWSIALAVSAVLALVLNWPALAAMFKVARPDAVLLSVSLAVALVSGGWFGVAQRLAGLMRRAEATPIDGGSRSTPNV